MLQEMMFSSQAEVDQGGEERHFARLSSAPLQASPMGNCHPLTCWPKGRPQLLLLSYPSTAEPRPERSHRILLKSQK